METPRTVELKIKSPSASIPDLQLSCTVEDTVGQVKSRVSLMFPTKPAPESQKLVYSGRILGDQDRLQDLLRWEDECPVFTFHLVCKVPAKQQTSSPPIPTSLSNTPSPPAPQDPSSMSMEQMMTDFSTQYTAAMASMPSHPSDQELAAMQTLYNQYISLYMQFLASQGLSTMSGPLQQPPMPMAQYLGQTNTPPAQLEPQNNPQPGVVGGGEADQAPPPNAALVMNAGGAAGAAVGQEEVGDRNRDMLDWVYVVTRVMLLFSIIYFHSSFLRLAFVMGLGFLVYVFQNRRLAMARRAEMEQAAEAARAAQANLNNAAEGDNDEVDDDSEHPAEVPEEETEEEPAPSKLAVVVTFVTTLISSIIPDQNQVV